jgi:hypothetical protein
MQTVWKRKTIAKGDDDGVSECICENCSVTGNDCPVNDLTTEKYDLRAKLETANQECFKLKCKIESDKEECCACSKHKEQLEAKLEAAEKERDMYRDNLIRVHDHLTNAVAERDEAQIKTAELHVELEEETDKLKLQLSQQDATIAGMSLTIAIMIKAFNNLIEYNLLPSKEYEDETCAIIAAAEQALSATPGTRYERIERAAEKFIEINDVRKSSHGNISYSANIQGIEDLYDALRREGE